MQVADPAAPVSMLTRDRVQWVLDRIHACDDADQWFATCGLAPREAWEQCERGDWLVYLCGRIGVDRRLLVRAAADCVRTVLSLVPVNEPGPRQAVALAEQWGRGDRPVEADAMAAAVYRAGATAERDGVSAAAHHAAMAATHLATVAITEFAGDRASKAVWRAACASACTAGDDAAAFRLAALAGAATHVRGRIGWDVVFRRLIAFPLRTETAA